MEMTLPPNYIDIAIVGAGPQSLTLITHILHKKPKLRPHILVFDPSGQWLQKWQHQFAAQEIPHLRSPAVHHPEPNPYALRQFAENRPNELFPPYDLPGTQLFTDFCREVSKRYQLTEQVYPDAVRRILPLDGRFQLLLARGESLVARRVVLATGDGKPSIPDWVNKIKTPYPEFALIHSSQVDLRQLSLTGEHILIVGGGLSSGHLAVGAISRGAKVDLMVRRELQEKLFDADPGWLGPKYLKGFMAESDYQKRWQMIKQARNGGSFTPEMMLKLRRLNREGKINLRERCQVIAAEWHNNYWRVKCLDGDTYIYDRIWLATGSELEAENHSLLGDIWDRYPTQFVQGLPILDDYLRVSGQELFIMGGLAALHLGPTARNLSGGIKASQRISEALVKPSLAISKKR